MTRFVALALAVALALPATAGAALRRKEDKRTGVTFRLDGKHLTMKLREQGDPRTVKRLVGKDATAACGTKSSGGGAVVNVDFTWPAERSSFAVDFDRDISKRVAYCLVEDRSGSDIAVVMFR
jgi:hypothetical protein